MEYLEKNQTLFIVFSQPKMLLNKNMYIANYGTKSHRFLVPKPIDPHLKKLESITHTNPPISLVINF
jgi:hypothetical protein